MRIQNLAMSSDDAGWMVGAAYAASANVSGSTTSNGPATVTGPSRAVIFHEVAGHWQLASSLPDAELLSVAMVSDSEGWAVGDAQRTVTTPSVTGGYPSVTVTYPAPLLLHYSAGTWTQQPNPVHDPDFQQSSLSNLVMFSPQEGWALATSDTTHIYQPYTAAVNGTLLHYHGGQWTEVKLPTIAGRDRFDIMRIAGTASGGIWLVGLSTWPRDAWVATGDGGYYPKVTPLILHNLNSAWTVISS